MPVDRPTFSESWYRVAELRPRLRGTVQVHRQHYRGRMWHIVQDPGANQFFRLNESAHRFVATLDGRRTVAEAWDACNDALGDDAPTQNEVIQLLGQLYTSNLLASELPPDAVGLFNRYRKRREREIRGYLTNFLFLRIPLFDPDAILNRWVVVFGRLFTRTGFALWLALMCVGLYFVLPRMDELAGQTAAFFSQQQLLGNLPLLYAVIVLLKAIHEFAHGFACKWFGRKGGAGGEVHTMGVMLLVFTPLPYVDASSSWAFRSKWHRIVVAAAGMYVELAVGAVAAIVWANTDPTSIVHAIAYNAIFIASVSTILFNANPLLRYDGYYILSDWLEIPNLQQRSRNYLYYLVRRYLWGVRNPNNPAHTFGERPWLLFYAVASTAYRVFICAAIIWFVANRLLIVGVALAVAAVGAWVFVPLGKFAHYLLTHNELSRTRGRAVASVVLALGLVVGGIGFVPVPDRVRIEGVVEPADLAFVFMTVDGTVEQVTGDGSAVRPDGAPLLVARSAELQAELVRIEADRDRLQRLRTMTWQQERARGENLEAIRQQVDQQLAALLGPDGRLARARDRIDALTVRAPIAGRWIAPDIESMRGAEIPRNTPIGRVAVDDAFVIRGVADQRQQARINTADPAVEIRLKGRPDIELAGRHEWTAPAGTRDLPSAALGYAAGGSILTAPGDQEGTRAAENVFDVLVRPDPEQVAGLKDGRGRPVALRSGQRVVIRYTSPPKPLAAQWYRSLRQLFEQRFGG